MDASTVHDAAPSRLLLGSCLSQHYEDSAVLWDAMAQRHASGMLWVGDAVYGDDYYDDHHHWWQGRTVRPATPAVLRALYQELLSEEKEKEGYRAFQRDGNVTILGVWDDHDYGVNNGDKLYPFRKESAHLYLDFLQQSNQRRDSPLDLSLLERRATAGLGIYGVKVFDFHRPKGQELLTDREAGIDPDTADTEVDTVPLSDRSVAVFLVDCRSNKSPWKKDFPEKFSLDYEGDFLGEEQWQWLETSLQRSTAAVNLIVQGLQVHADRYFDGNLAEDWSRFPKAQHRLYQTILSSGAKAPVLISGDVHMSELLRRDCQPYVGGGGVTRGDRPPSRMLLEVTVSGMTHSWCSNLCPRPQSGLICRIPWFHWSLCMGMRWAHRTPAWTDLVDLPTPHEAHAKRGRQYVLERNFGEMEFDWQHRQLIVRVLSRTGETLISTAWPFDLLSGTTEPTPTGRLQRSDYETTYQRLFAHNVSQPNDWICLNHRGVTSLGVKIFGVASPIFVACFIMFFPLHVTILVLWMIWRRKRRTYHLEMKVKKL